MVRLCDPLVVRWSCFVVLINLVTDDRNLKSYGIQNVNKPRPIPLFQEFITS